MYKTQEREQKMQGLSLVITRKRNDIKRRKDAIALQKLNDLMAEPDFQMVATDIKTGHQTVSPVIALRDKQRDLFQQQLAKLREEALRRSITRKNMRI